MGTTHTRFTYQSLVEYLEDIATKSKLINSFAERDHEEILTEMDSTEELPVMVIDPPTAQKIDLRSSNVQDAWRIVFEILDYKSTKSATVAETKQVISTCKAIADQVLSYLRRESQENRLPGFDETSIEGAPIIYESDGYMGWETKIEILVPINLSFNADNWDL